MRTNELTQYFNNTCIAITIIDYAVGKHTGSSAIESDAYHAHLVQKGKIQ